MKVSDLRERAVYVGKNGKRREILVIGRFGRIAGDVIYDREEGGVGRCTGKSFARWAEREEEQRGPRWAKREETHHFGPHRNALGEKPPSQLSRKSSRS